MEIPIMANENVNLNPWIVAAPKEFKALPVGAYMGVFKGVETYDLHGEMKVTVQPT